MEDPTKTNYETGHDWHAEKSRAYNWLPQIGQFLRSINEQRMRVLDVGCGDGRDVQSFSERGITVEGLDYSHPAIKGLKQRFPKHKFYEASMLDTKLPEQTYDGVWACASILNLKKADIPQALAEFNRLLAPSGALFISVKEGEGERMIPDQVGERLFSFFSESEITELVKKAGFSISETEILDDATMTGNTDNNALRWICVYAKKI